MNQDFLSELLAKKRERQSLLDQKRKELEQVELDLLSSQLGKSMSNFGYGIIRFVYLILGLSLFISGCVLLVSPKVFYSYCHFIDCPEVIAQTRMEEYSSFIDNSDDETNKSNFITKLEKDIRSRHDQNIRLLALSFIFVSLFLFYKCKHLKSIRLRNRQVVEMSKRAQQITHDFNMFIKEERGELHQFEKIVGSIDNVSE